MKYTVLWSPEAESLLIDIWIGASDRKLITDAANRIDRQLSFVPLDVGESRTEAARLLMEPPLAVFYEVHDDESLVVIHKIWE